MTEQQLARMAKRRLAILRHAEEITGKVALTCRYYAISGQMFYPWRRRYDADGLDGLRTAPTGRWSAPTPPQALPRHPHQPSGVWRILKRLA